MNRTFYIDNLRIFLTVLVIVHHAAIAYGASGGWCYVTPDKLNTFGQVSLSIMLSINQAFFMSLFFFISAYFMPGSLENKGFSRYLKDRLLRLGLPLAITVFIFNPALLYAVDRHIGNTDSNILEYAWNYLTNYPNTSHMWFVFALLVFETIYALYKKYSSFSVSLVITDKLPGKLQIFLFIVAGGLLAFALRLIYPIGGKNFMGLQLGYFVLYSLFYALGIVASRKKWLERFTGKESIIWSVAAIVLLPAIVFAWLEVVKKPEIVVEYIGGLHWRSLFLSVWEAVVCFGLCFSLLIFFRKYFNSGKNFLTELAKGSYFVYFSHAIVLVTFTILFEPINLLPFIKFLLTAVFTVSTCFLFAHFVRKVSVLRKIF